jgi:hypothetical protein
MRPGPRGLVTSELYQTRIVRRNHYFGTHTDYVGQVTYRPVAIRLAGRRLRQSRTVRHLLDGLFRSRHSSCPTDRPRWRADRRIAGRPTGIMH